MLKEMHTKFIFWYMSKHKRKSKRKAISLMTNSSLNDKKGIL